VKLARFIGNGILLILCGSQAQQEKILKMEKLKGKKMKSHVPGAYGRLRGVITGVPISISKDDIKENVKGGRMIEAKRLISRKEGQRSESLSVMMRFEKVLPGKAQIGFLSFNVRELVPYALHCFKCQIIDVAAQCKGKKICAKCGGAHDYGECGSNVKVKCCNCVGGDKVQHLVDARYRERLERLRDIGSVMVYYNAEAVKHIGRTIITPLSSSSLTGYSDRQCAQPTERGIPCRCFFRKLQEI
jgi:hypothetical protein